MNFFYLSFQESIFSFFFRRKFFSYKGAKIILCPKKFTPPVFPADHDGFPKTGIPPPFSPLIPLNRIFIYCRSSPVHSKGRFRMNRGHLSPEDPERRKWQDPEAILSSIGISAGMIFVDMGCGEGYFALPAARRVGRKGKVYANDIDAGAVERLRTRAAQEGLDNLSAEVREAEKTLVCEGCADIVFFGIDLHDFRDPAAVLVNARKMLRHGGRLVDLDWKDQPMAFGPPREKRFSIEKARNLMGSAGFRIVSVQDAGPYHYLIIARP
jgi:ubiquinone/menaquinone biosynthesis C-methylase UbiE